MVFTRKIQRCRVGVGSSSVVVVTLYDPSLTTHFSSAVSALLNVMTMYHDTLLARIVRNDRNYRPLIPSSHHTRFTKAWLERSNIYKWAARMLEIIRFTELVVEMGLRRNTSSKTRWRTVVLLEVIKYLVSIFRLVYLLTLLSLAEPCSVSFCYASPGDLCYLLQLPNVNLIRQHFHLQVMHLRQLLCHRLPHLHPLQPLIISGTTVLPFRLIHC